MNSYLDFLDKVRESLPDYLPAEYADAEIQVRRTEKHLSDSYDGICFKPFDSDLITECDNTNVFVMLV